MKIHKNGNQYRVRVKVDGKWGWKVLGTDYAEACEKLEELLGVSVKSFANAAKRYKKEVMPHKAEKTSVVQYRQLDKLIRIFGHMDVNEIKPPIIIEYIDRRGCVSANREIALLRHVLTKCVHWGWLDYNPIMRLQYRFKEGRRDRVVSAEEIRFVMKRANKRERYLIWMVYLTGLRREDALAITDMSFRDGYLHVTEGKTGKKVRIELSPSLDRLRAKLSPAYFQNVTESGIDSAWQRLRKKLKPYELFQLKDLRAAHAGEVEDRGGDATRQLGHSSRTVTQNHYLRAGRKVTPIR